MFWFVCELPLSVNVFICFFVWGVFGVYMCCVMFVVVVVLLFCLCVVMCVCVYVAVCCCVAWFVLFGVVVVLPIGL